MRCIHVHGLLRATVFNLLGDGKLEQRDMIMIKIVKKRSPSRDYIYCVYVDSRLVLHTKRVAAVSPWLKLMQAA